MSNQKKEAVQADRSDEKRKFRGKMSKTLPSLKNPDPNHEYHWVCIDRDFGPGYNDECERVEEFIDNGWNVVYSEDSVVDGVETNKSPAERLKPVTKRTKGGRTQILMKCTIEQRQKNEQAQAKKDRERLEASVKSIKREGQNEIITDHEIDASKFSH